MTRSLFFRFLFALLCLGCLGQAFSQQVFSKVLFLGNSITKHAPKPDIDWHTDWGMAASAESKDYVHLVTKGLADKSGKSPEIMVKNIADFERAHVGYDISAKLKEAIDFRADLIVLAIGENVPDLNTEEKKAQFQAEVTRLLKALVGDRKPTLLVRSCFWANGPKDEALKAACGMVGGRFVDISALGKEEKHFARSERPFKHDGVAGHPGDAGMAAIAHELLKALGK